MDCNLDSNKPIKSRYKYRIISKSCRRYYFTNIDRCRIISSAILGKFLKFISIDICICICIEFQLYSCPYSTMFEHIVAIKMVKRLYSYNLFTIFLSWPWINLLFHYILLNFYWQQIFLILL